MSFLILISGALLFAIIIAARITLVSYCSINITANLRRTLFNHIISLDHDFFASTRSGDILSTVIYDAYTVQDLITTGFPITIRNCITLIGCVIMLVHANVELALYLLLSIPIIILIIKYIGKSVKQLARKLEIKTRKLRFAVRKCALELVLFMLFSAKTSKKSSSLAI